MNKEEVEETKKKIDRFQVHFRQGLDKQGEKVYLEVIFNKEVSDMIKKAIIDETTNSAPLRVGVDEQGRSINKHFKRYRVKRVIFASLSYQPDYMFIKELLNKGKKKFEFHDLNRLDEFKNNLESNLQKVISFLLGVEREDIIKFKVRGD